MKKNIFYLLLLAILAMACEKAAYLAYADIARIQLADTALQSSTFIYEPSTVIKDTLYIKVNTIGDISNVDRPVALEQVTEYNYSYVKDPVSGITDTITTELPFKAVAGVHYLPMNDPSIASLMVVKANEVTAMLPIVILRDASLKENSYRLRVQLVANSAFSLGEHNARAKTFQFSDKLERFFSWRIDNTSAPAFNTFGKYSTGKHQFMVDVLKDRIDEEWYQAILAMQATASYANMLKEELIKYNADPENIANGKAPLRETESITSPLVAFP